MEAAGGAIGDPVFDGAWDEALRLAWDGYRCNTTPVGAVVTDLDGVVIASGRGRRYEKVGPAGQLAGSHVAHAELNALAQLDAGRHWRDVVLLTTLEPCGMCHGAAVQSTITTLYYAGPDPYGGTASMAFATPQARRRPLRIAGPLRDHRGALAALLHIGWLMDRPSAAHVVAAQAAALPDLTGYVAANLGRLRAAAAADDFDAALTLAGEAAAKAGI